jgi:GAF domain-containing protein
VEPVPETRDVLQELRSTSGQDFTARLRELVPMVLDSVPSCVGLSITLAQPGLTFTLVATTEQVATLDGVQYASGGPCVTSATEGEDVQVDDMMDEHRWQEFAMAAAAQDVRSSLSLPLTRDGAVIGAVNLYAADPGAFDGQQETLRAIFGTPVGLVAVNADLSFRTRREAEQAPATLHELDVVEQAVGFLAASQRVGIPEARAVLHDAAFRASVDVPALARVILRGE